MSKNQPVFIDHHVSQLWGVNEELLNNQGKLSELAHKVAKELNLTIVNSYVHKFEPYGLSLVLVIAESHLAIHTWPEFGYMHVDTLSCSEKGDLSKVKQALKKEFSPSKIESRKIDY